MIERHAEHQRLMETMPYRAVVRRMLIQTGEALAGVYMWIVRLALRRPYTFIVMALLIAILGVMSILTTPTDVFPYINIPVAGVIWSYSGMSPDDMAKRVLLISERAMTTTVNSIAHIEATAYNGVV